MRVNLHIIHPEYHIKLQLVHHTNCAQIKYAGQITSSIDPIKNEAFLISIWDDLVLRKMVVNPVLTVCDCRSILFICKYKQIISLISFFFFTTIET